MTLANEPDITARNAIVQRDLGNVLHPIVQHKQLERQQLVIVGAKNSTIVDRIISLKVCQCGSFFFGWDLPISRPTDNFSSHA